MINLMRGVMIEQKANMHLVPASQRSAGQGLVEGAAQDR